MQSRPMWARGLKHDRAEGGRGSPVAPPKLGARIKWVSPYFSNDI